jgi:hypothetical protein
VSEPSDRTLTGQAASRTSSDGDEAYCAACNQSYSIDEMFCPKDGSRLVKLLARPDALIGRVFDQRYELRSVLGNGGMGTVYRGWQLSVDREVAIKVIHSKLASIRSVAKRFLREARLSSRLSEASIVQVYDFGHTEDGILYIVMELLRGDPLARMLETRRPIEVRRITRIGIQICEALEAAHAIGIVHRDLKPQNIMLLDDAQGRDRLKVLDFGLAKSFVNDDSSLVTGTDALLGTPLYMPPEQILGNPVDQRADLYALGCILFQMATGRPPFANAENANVVLAAHLRDDVPQLPEQTPRPLAALIRRLLAKSAEDRPATAGLVRTALVAVQEGAPNTLLEPGALATPRKRPKWLPWAAVIALGVGLGGGLALRLAMKSSTTTPTAAPAAVIDAGAPPAGIDAELALPAAPPIEIDAGVIHRGTSPGRRREPPHRRADGGLPDIDLLPSTK